MSLEEVLSLIPDELGKLPVDGGPRFNRLVFEKSPYLLQHALNPVNWYPWGNEAFERAGIEEKPVFLSIGYSTCHWCHVMERESFENEDVAALLNEHFISVKVDREERPDLDNIFMTVTQGLTGSGGWPMTLVLTPDGKPFFAGTYFPRESVGGRPGMLEILPTLSETWENRRSEVVESAGGIVRWLNQNAALTAGTQLDEKIFSRVYRDLAQRFDPSDGGFGGAPKFPTTHNLTFLLRYWKRSGEPHALEMVESTLEHLMRGGIFDHIGYGFHRYSTDRHWLVPHFEKMLYDQALLADVCLEAYQVTGRKDFALTARRIFEYVLREMTDEEGGFYSAEDADSEGEEGRFYIWNTDEVDQILGEGAELFCEVYGLDREGNFRDEATGTYTGSNILHLRRPLEKVAQERGLPFDQLSAGIESARKSLFDVREKRIHPFKDDKILTDWNGLMIAALARGGSILDEPALTGTAERAADFVWTRLRDSEGRLLKRYRSKAAGLPAHLDDYAFFLYGLIELYQSNFKTLYLERALIIADQIIGLFHDEENGGFFFTAEDSEKLLARKKEILDGALPSGNSVAALSLLRLGRLTARSDLEKAGTEVLRAFGGQISRSPAGFTGMMCAFDFLSGPTNEIVIAGMPGSEDVEEMLRALRRTYLPSAVVVFRPAGQEIPAISILAPYTLDQKEIEGKATAYVCSDHACQLPVTSVEEMLENLTHPKPSRNG